MYHFCTYFDVNYLPQGIALYRSLAEHCERDFFFYVLCLDEKTFRILEKIDVENIVPISLENLEQWDGRLKAAKENRSLIEYYFTLSPALPAYILERFEGVDCVVYLDADVFFFSSPTCLFQELGDSSILITEHRFSEHLRKRQRFGRFNVQCQMFRNDEVGRCCLDAWRTQCIEWCYDRLEDGKFADQKYLDNWPELYESLVVSKHPGVGVAPWNIHGQKIRRTDQGLVVGDAKLVFFHFHGFRWLGWTWCKTGLWLYWASLDQKSKRLLYGGYLGALQKASIFLMEASSVKVSPYVFKGGVRFGGSWRENVWQALVQRDYYSPWLIRI